MSKMNLQIHAQEGIEIFLNGNGGITLKNDEGSIIAISTPQVAKQISKAVIEMAKVATWRPDEEEVKP